MISITHPLLPYNLEYDEITGSAVRRRGTIAEQGNLTDGLLAVLLLELQKRPTLEEIATNGRDFAAATSAIHEQVDTLKAQVESLKAEVAKLKRTKSAE